MYNIIDLLIFTINMSYIVGAELSEAAPSKAPLEQGVAQHVFLTPQLHAVEAGGERRVP